MFGKQREKNSPLQGGAAKFETIIGPHALMEGHLRIKESVRIDGKVIGDILAAADQTISVVVGEHGEVKGNIQANVVVVAGKVIGNIHAFERLELHAQCRVEGDIRYASLAMEHGSTVLGLLLQSDDKKTAAVAVMAQKTLEKAAK